MTASYPNPTPAFLGDTTLLSLPERTAFLSSRRITPAAVLRCLDWAESCHDTDGCILGGFHSPLERDVLRFLLRGHIPVVMALARPLWKTIPPDLRSPLEEGRLLLVAPLPPTSGRRASSATCAARNRWILAHSTRLVLGTLDPAGSLVRLLADFPDLPRSFCP